MKLKQLFISLFLICTVCRSYAQHSLTDCIEAAKQNSPLITDNKNQAIANKIEAERLKASYTKPQVGLSANYLLAPIFTTDNNRSRFELNPNDAVNYYGYDLGATNGGTYQAFVSLTQPLFSSQVSGTMAQQANINAQINENTVKLTGHDLEKLITDQYILVLQDKKQANYASGIAQLLDQQIGIVKKLVAASILKSSDLILLNIEQGNNAALLISFESNYKRDLFDLNILSGMKDTTTVSLDSISLALKTDAAASAYLDKYRLDSLNLVASQKAFETRYRPQFNFFTNAGLNAVYAPTIPRRFGFSAGLGFTWNFFDGGQKALSQNRTRALLQSVNAYKENFETQNALRKAKILAELSSYDVRMRNSKSQLQSYNDLINTFKKQIIQGQLSVIDFINVIKSKSATERDYLLLETNRQLLINAYNYWNW